MTRSTPNLRPTRRAVLRGAGCGAVVWSGGTFLVDSGTVEAASNASGYDGLLVMIYDDSPREDYSQTFPVHQEYGVPGCVAVCPGLMGTAGWLHPGQLEELHDAGWEVMSHTMKHRSLGAIPVWSDIEEGDTEIHVQSSLHGRFPGDPVFIHNVQQQTTATVAGREDTEDAAILVLEEPIDTAFDVRGDHHTWVRYTDEFTRGILAESKTQIEEWGFGPVTSYVHPYNRYDGYVSEVVGEYYDAVPNRHQGAYNQTFGPDPLQLSRANFEEDSMALDELEEVLDVIANEPEFGILYGHSQHETLTPNRIARTIELAQERNIAIVTLQQAMVELGVWADESGTPAADPDDSTHDSEEEDEEETEHTDDEAADDSTTPTEDDELVGFGAIGALLGLGGAGYLLARRHLDSSRQE